MSQSKTRFRIHGFLIVLAILAGAAQLRADVTGTILGIIKDPSSAVLPGVEVTATNLDTNLAQQSRSDGTGEYRILALPVGRYKVEASLAGFQKFVATGIVLDVNEQHRLDITLQLGNVEQTVEVKDLATAQIETTNTQLGEVVDEKKVLTLPLNGRSYIDLLGLQAGVVPTTSGSIQQDRSVSGGLSAGNISVNGQRETANAFLVNGGDVTEGRNLGASVIPNLDSVAEFRLITNSFDAEYGRFSGAIMNAVTKSGSNSFHGTAFEFLRNEKLDARNFFDPERGVFRRNQFGYAVGGPAIKDRLFWHTDYQGTRETRGISTGLVLLPTATMRQGNFSGLNAFLDADGNPATVKGPGWAAALSSRLGYSVTDGMPYSPAGCNSTADCVFPGGIIPQRAFSSAAVGTLKYIPLPNVGTDHFSTAGANNRIRDDKFGQKIDFNNKLTGNWSFYYFIDDSTVTNPLAGANVPGFSSITPSRAQQFVINHNYVFGPTTVNEARIGFTRMSTTTDKPNGGYGNLKELGFVTGEGSLGIINSGPPGFDVIPHVNLNNTGVSIGNNTLTTTQPNNTFYGAENFSKIYKNHTFKFGGEARYLQINERNVCGPTGFFDFDGTETGNDFADYLIGAPSSFGQCSQQFLDSRSHYGAAFMQDSFRIKPNLTLNYGLRWEYSQPWWDTQGKIETIVPGLQSTQFPTAPLGWVVPGDPGIPKTLAPTDYNNFGPRIGLAYSPGFSDGALGKLFGGPGKTSIRASYGIYYTAIEDLNLFYEVGDAPFGRYWTAPLPVRFEEPYRTRFDGTSQGQRFPFKFPIPGDPANKTLDYSGYLPISYSPGYDIHNRQPYAEHYNFTIQRELSPSTVLSLAYVGTQGHKLISQYDANPGDPRLCQSLTGSGVMAGTPECGPNLSQLDFTRPDGTIVHGTRTKLGPAFGYGNTYTANIANSNYNSFQATLERKAANFTFLGAYTFSKAIDNSSAFGQWVNFTNYRLSRSLSDYDLTHNFVFSYNYLLPFDRAFSKGPKRLTQGWSITGITRFATGFPIFISQGEDRSLVDSGATDVPNFKGGLKTQDPRLPAPDGTPNLYFNPDAFETGPLGQFGNANRKFFHGPGFNNWDFSLQKSTQLTESMSVHLRAEFFNIFNHTQFHNPSGDFSDSQFGFVTNARDPRIGQLSLKFMW